jgi:hypothetical protein
MFIRNLLLFVFLGVVLQSCYSQNTLSFQGEIFKTGCVTYKGTDSISYVYNSGSYSKNKPGLLFIQGSLPRPIIFDVDDSTSVVTALSSFPIDDLINHFNVFVISKPYTPLRVSMGELNQQYLYVPDLNNPNCFDTNYQRTNNLEYCSERISYFIDYIHKQYEFDQNGFSLIGHSQGAIEAARVSRINRNVDYCAILSTNYLGRIQDRVMRNRWEFNLGLKDSATYTNDRQAIYADWEYIVNNPANLSCTGDPNQTTYSFSQSILDDVLSSDAKFFFGIGSLDMGSSIADLIPIYFIQKKKERPKVKIYEGLEHNFFPLTETGMQDYSNCKWPEVISDINNWKSNAEK